MTNTHTYSPFSLTHSPTGEHDPCQTLKNLAAWEPSSNFLVYHPRLVKQKKRFFLYRSDHSAAAEPKLLRAMLSNLYLIPHLLGLEQPELDIWHGSNIDRKDYLPYIPPELLSLWDEAALQWARETYDNPKFSQVRDRYIEIHRQLKDEPRGPTRSQLVQEAFSLYKLT